MLDHVSVTVSDLARSAPFWDAVMAALGVPCAGRDERWIGYGTRNRDGDDGHSYLSLRATGGPVATDGRHWAFRAPTRAAVDAFHAAGLAAGGGGEGAPGERPRYGQGYYGAYLRDPEGNKLHVVHRGDLAGG